MRAALATIRHEGVRRSHRGSNARKNTQPLKTKTKKNKRTLADLIGKGLTGLNLFLEGVLEIDTTLLNGLHLLFQIGLVLLVLGFLRVGIPDILDSLKVFFQLLDLLVFQSLATSVCLIQLLLDITDLCVRLPRWDELRKVMVGVWRYISGEVRGSL